MQKLIYKTPLEKSLEKLKLGKEHVNRTLRKMPIITTKEQKTDKTWQARTYIECMKGSGVPEHAKYQFSQVLLNASSSEILILNSEKRSVYKGYPIFQKFNYQHIHNSAYVLLTKNDAHYKVDKFDHEAFKPYYTPEGGWTWCKPLGEDSEEFLLGFQSEDKNEDEMLEEMQKYIDLITITPEQIQKCVGSTI